MWHSIIAIVVTLSLFSNRVQAKQGYGAGGKQDWGYVDVREGAHMFYWLHYTTATLNFTERPLVIWLQGGPGGSSSGFGNFMEIGPLDKNGNERNNTWVKDVNVLFIDNPVGTGFSYVDNEKFLTTNNQQIAKDLVTFMKSFYEKYADFEQVPLHIFGESYGGKMAPKFALELYDAIQRKELRSNLTSVVLISPAISKVEAVTVIAPLLFYLGIVDNDGYNSIMEAAEKVKDLIKDENWNQAFEQWQSNWDLILNESLCVNIYNMLTPQGHNNCNTEGEKVLEPLMNGPVGSNLSIPLEVKWGSQRSSTYENLIDDIMRPAIHVVSEVLNRTNIRVGVVSGQLDLIIPTAATFNWINKMEWTHKHEYLAAPRNGIYVNDILEGHEKTGGKLSLFGIYRSGHMVPIDNSKAMQYILRKFTNYG